MEPEDGHPSLIVHVVPSEEAFFPLPDLRMDVSRVFVDPQIGKSLCSRAPARMDDAGPVPRCVARPRANPQPEGIE